MKNRLFGAAIIPCSLFIAKDVVAQTPSERHARIRAAMEAGDLRGTLSEPRLLHEANAAAYNDKKPFSSQ